MRGKMLIVVYVFCNLSTPIISFDVTGELPRTQEELAELSHVNNSKSYTASKAIANVNDEHLPDVVDHDNEATEVINDDLQQTLISKIGTESIEENLGEQHKDEKSNKSQEVGNNVSENNGSESDHEKTKHINNDKDDYEDYFYYEDETEKIDDDSVTGRDAVKGTPVKNKQNHGAILDMKARTGLVNIDENISRSGSYQNNDQTIINRGIPLNVFNTRASFVQPDQIHSGLRPNVDYRNTGINYLSRPNSVLGSDYQYNMNPSFNQPSSIFSRLPHNSFYFPPPKFSSQYHKRDSTELLNAYSHNSMWRHNYDPTSLFPPHSFPNFQVNNHEKFYPHVSHGPLIYSRPDEQKLCSNCNPEFKKPYNYHQHRRSLEPESKYKSPNGRMLEGDFEGTNTYPYIPLRDGIEYYPHLPASRDVITPHPDSNSVSKQEEINLKFRPAAKNDLERTGTLNPYLIPKIPNLLLNRFG